MIMQKLTLLAFGLLLVGAAKAQTTTTPMSSSYSSTTTSYSTAPTRIYSTTGTTGNYSTNGTTGAYNSNGTMGNGSITTGTYSTNSYSSQATAPDRKTDRPYKAVTVGVYAGVNSTRFKGENVDGNNLTGRIGYQAGVFVRGGGRVYGQIGAEYFASSSNYFKPGDGQTTKAINDQIDVKYIQIPALVGVKLAQSDRGISAVRLAVGVEYANRISSNSNTFNLSNSEIKSGSFNGIGNVGFDFGPVLIDLMYHYGFSDALQVSGYQGSQRRIVSASVGFKF
jgi:Outer membrane protein beta-barrel domain